MGPTIIEAVLRELRQWTKRKEVSLADRLLEDLHLDDLEQGEVALRLERALQVKPTAAAYRTVLTAADFVRVFETALRST